jgi:hypothetical protein
MWNKRHGERCCGWKRERNGRMIAMNVVKWLANDRNENDLKIKF